MKYICICLLSIALLGCPKKEKNPTYPPLATDEIATLPVVFHVIHQGTPVGTGDNISQTTIQSCLNALNSYFQNSGPDIKIQFKMARYKPTGELMTEPGIDRVNANGYGYIYMNQNNPIINANNWNPKEYINVWICNIYDGSYNTTSFAYYPVAPDTHPISGLSTVSYSTAVNYIPAYPDGVYLNTSTFTYNRYAQALTHEMGHYFGLYHVFNDNTCGDDYVSDTYHYNRYIYNLYLTQANQYYRLTCYNTTVLGNNFMDYDYQKEFKFTYGQMLRMREVLSYCPQRAVIRYSNKRMGRSQPLIDRNGLYPQGKYDY